MENCLEFGGFRVTYWLEVLDKNASASSLSCHAAISITQAPDGMWGLLYVNDSEPLHRPECQDLRYAVVAQEEFKELETSTQIQVLLDGEGEAAVPPSSEQTRLQTSVKSDPLLSWFLLCSGTGDSGQPAAPVLR